MSKTAKTLRVLTVVENVEFMFDDRPFMAIMYLTAMPFPSIVIWVRGSVDARRKYFATHAISRLRLMRLGATSLLKELEGSPHG